MGQARQRGTKAERMAQAIARNEEALIDAEQKARARKIAERERIAAMSSEQRKAYQGRLYNSRLRAVMLAASLAALAEQGRARPKV